MHCEWPLNPSSSRGKEVMGEWARGSKVADQVYKTKRDEEAIRQAVRGPTAIREALRSGAMSEVAALRAEALQGLGTVSNGG